MRKEGLPSGHAVEHVVAERKALILGQDFRTLGHDGHLNEWDQLIRVLQHFPELAHVGPRNAPFLLFTSHVNCLDGTADAGLLTEGPQLWQQVELQ